MNDKLFCEWRNLLRRIFFYRWDFMPTFFHTIRYREIDMYGNVCFQKSLLKMTKLLKLLFDRVNFNPPQIQTFERRCLTFFVELVTEFCFVRDDSQEIEQQLLQRVMGYAFHTKENQTKQFSPIEDFAIDPTPIIRSFILQQLLKRWVV